MRRKPANAAEARRLYLQAAQLGNVAAQYNLAYLYEQGSGVDQSESEASKWYQLAAKGGDPLAQFDIGQRYHLGLGVTANQAEAVKWLTLAAAQGQARSEPADTQRNGAPRPELEHLPARQLFLLIRHDSPMNPPDRRGNAGNPRSSWTVLAAGRSRRRRGSLGRCPG